MAQNDDLSAIAIMFGIILISCMVLAPLVASVQFYRATWRKWWSRALIPGWFLLVLWMINLPSSAGSPGAKDLTISWFIVGLLIVAAGMLWGRSDGIELGEMWIRDRKGMTLTVIVFIMGCLEGFGFLMMEETGSMIGTGLFALIDILMIFVGGYYLWTGVFSRA